MKIGVIESDKRFIQVKTNLSKDFDVVMIQDEQDFVRALKDVSHLVLPIRPCDEEGNIASLQTKSFIDTIPDHIVLYAGMNHHILNRLANKKFYYMEDPSLIATNAVLTAEGILHEMIEKSDVSIFEQSVDIIGYGNCGKALYKILQDLHIKTRIIRRDCTEDENFIKVEHWTTCANIVINTSLSCVINEQRMSLWHQKPLILDISTPDVIDTVYAEKHRISLIKEPNLPGRFACVSAGNAIANYIRGTINHEK